MKTQKTITRKITKKVDPTYTIDLTNVTNIEQFFVEKALAKYSAGIPLTKEDLTAIVQYVANIANRCTAVYLIDEIFEDCNGAVIENGKIIPIEFEKTILKDDEEIVVRNSCKKIRKQNVFKRFWNWLTRKNK